MAEVTEAEFVEMLQELLESRELTDADYSAGVRTYDDAMMMTLNKGLVVDVGGSQLTVVQSG